jgi:hypothetical protein
MSLAMILVKTAAATVLSAAAVAVVSTMAPKSTLDAKPRALVLPSRTDDVDAMVDMMPEPPRGITAARIRAASAREARAIMLQELASQKEQLQKEWALAICDVGRARQFEMTYGYTSVLDHVTPSPFSAIEARLKKVRDAELRMTLFTPMEAAF